MNQSERIAKLRDALDVQDMPSYRCECGSCSKKREALAILDNMERAGKAEECPYCGPDGTEYRGDNSRICPHCGGSHEKSAELERRIEEAGK